MRETRSVILGAFAAIVVAGVMVQAARANHVDASGDVVRAAVPPGAIKHLMVIDLENESFASTFGPSSPAVYLNQALLPQGELVTNYFATGHVSLDNYIAQVSGQGSTVSTNNDCLNVASLFNPPVVGGFTDVLPGTDAIDEVQFPGQVTGDGCVFPAPGAGTHGATTIGDQLDALPRLGESGHLTWRGYAEDMGDDLARDYGSPDPLGGGDCAHPPIGGKDFSNSASPADQYATRHNPFVYFHSVIDDVGRCNAHVVPLGKLAVGQNGAPDVFQGHLFEDLQKIETTPAFMFVTPNLCDDGHDAFCAGPNVEGTTDAKGRNIGGLVGADLWLKHWMPMIFSSPAYRTGQLLVVVTFDEASPVDTRACPAASQADCHAPDGPNVTNFGFSTLLAMFGLQKPPSGPGVYPGGGQVGAVLFNRLFIRAGSVNTTGSYTHFSALRSYEDLLGITRGGDDGFGHIGFASTPDLQPFGRDVFNAR
jgi:hypothetical protein